MLKHKVGAYTIECIDDKNYTVTRSQVVREGKTKGETVKSIEGYYNSLVKAVKAVAKLLANSVKGETLDEWLAEYRRVLNQFEDAVGEFK